MSKVRNWPSASKAYEETTKRGIIAVKVTTYCGETISSIDYYSYKSAFNSPEDLREDFPLCLASNQAIEEIDQDS